MNGVTIHKPDGSQEDEIEFFSLSQAVGFTNRHAGRTPEGTVTIAWSEGIPLFASIAPEQKPDY
jgi:hypothetical protein